MTLRIPILPVLFIVAAALLPPSARADSPQAKPGDPVWMHLGADDQDH